MEIVRTRLFSFDLKSLYWFSTSGRWTCRPTVCFRSGLSEWRKTTTEWAFSSSRPVTRPTTARPSGNSKWMISPVWTRNCSVPPRSARTLKTLIPVSLVHSPILYFIADKLLLLFLQGDRAPPVWTGAGTAESSEATPTATSALSWWMWDVTSSCQNSGSSSCPTNSFQWDLLFFLLFAEMP